MFAWVGSKFDAVLNAYVLAVVTELISALAPLAVAGTTLWIALYGWAVLRHEVNDALSTFVWRLFKIGLIFTICLQSGLYLSTVADTANALATGVATTFVPKVGSPLVISTPYALLDTFNDGASQLVVDLLKDAGITRLDLVFAAIVTAVGNVIFLCLALFVVTLAKVFMTFTIAVGPLFVMCLAWRPTARFFDSWLSMVLNSVVLAWFAFFALGLSAYIGNTLVGAIQDQGGFAGPTFNVVGESLKYCIVMVLMAIICFQAPSLASALTGGVAVQQGLQMVQNVLNASPQRSSHRSNPVTHIAARTSSSFGRSYAVGRAAGGIAGDTARSVSRGVAQASRYASRRGMAIVRTAAYRLAALRGSA